MTGLFKNASIDFLIHNSPGTSVDWHVVAWIETTSPGPSLLVAQILKL